MTEEAVSEQVAGLAPRPLVEAEDGLVFLGKGAFEGGRAEHHA